MRQPRKGPSKVRLTIDLEARSRDRLERLRGVTEAETMTEIVRRALAVYEVLWNATAAGGSVVIRQPGEADREIVLL